MEIGGYFELELSSNKKAKFLENGIPLNSGRNALRLLIRTKKFKNIYVPRFICSSVTEVLKKESVNILKYGIDENLEIKNEKFLPNIPLIYVNYFGIKDSYSNKLKSIFKNLIIDNCQALYSTPIEGAYTIYSPRKFLGIPDGGYLIGNMNVELEIIELDKSNHRFGHLLKRIEYSPKEGFEDYKNNNIELGRSEVKKMSRLTDRIINSIDHVKIKQRRIDNFYYLHDFFKGINQLNIDVNTNFTPMVYPLLLKNKGVELKKHLINNLVFVATYWPNILNEDKNSSFEKYLTQNIVPLPIDQRYGKIEMERILHLVKSFGNLH